MMQHNHEHHQAAWCQCLSTVQQGTTNGCMSECQQHISAMNCDGCTLSPAAATICKQSGPQAASIAVVYVMADVQPDAWCVAGSLVYDGVVCGFTTLPGSSAGLFNQGARPQAMRWLDDMLSAVRAGAVHPVVLANPALSGSPVRWWWCW